jgi:hypothetical protein
MPHVSSTSHILVNARIREGDPPIAEGDIWPTHNGLDVRSPEREAYPRIHVVGDRVDLAISLLGGDEAAVTWLDALAEVVVELRGELLARLARQNRASAIRTAIHRVQSRAERNMAEGRELLGDQP